MPKSPKKILAVPTTIVTGFLGVGKTSTILHFLKHKPVEERWTVLVNEFGKIGVDGSLYQGRYGEENGVFVGEVQGGCMCCSANLPMQIALNKLLAVARPQRLLIEPTGLGHPFEILKILKGKHYRDVLSIQKILTLVDARNLVKQQYIEHDTFNQQIEIADVIVGNKADLYSNADRQRLTSYIKEKSSKQTQLIFTMFGELDQRYLEGSTAHTTAQTQYDNQAVEKLDSVGWCFPATKIT